MAQPCLPMGPFPNKLTEKKSRRARVTIWEFFLKFFFFFNFFIGSPAGLLNKPLGLLFFFFYSSLHQHPRNTHTQHTSSTNE